jgi:hypothetical protein
LDEAGRKVATPLDWIEFAGRARIRWIHEVQPSSLPPQRPGSRD